MDVHQEPLVNTGCRSDSERVHALLDHRKKCTKRSEIGFKIILNFSFDMSDNITTHDGPMDYLVSSFDDSGEFGKHIVESAIRLKLSEMAFEWGGVGHCESIKKLPTLQQMQSLLVSCEHGQRVLDTLTEDDARTYVFLKCLAAWLVHLHHSSPNSIFSSTELMITTLWPARG